MSAFLINEDERAVKGGGFDTTIDELEGEASLRPRHGLLTPIYMP
jgi:hypothetical protein